MPFKCPLKVKGYAVNPSICEMKDVPIVVITDGWARGLTLNVYEYKKARLNSLYDGFDYSKTSKVAFSVNREEMIDMFMKMLLGELV